VPDVVIASTPGPYGLLGALVAKWLGVPLCVGYHTRYDKLIEIYWQRGYGKRIGALINGFNRLMFRLGTVVVATSELMAREARKSGISQVEVVGTPIAPHFMKAPVRSLSPHVESILYAGRLAPEKNIDDILEAAERLPNIRFRIAGDGPLRESVEQKARRLPNIEFLGWIPRREMRSVIDRCDILVLPSQVESFGTIALEAMVRQKLVVVSSHCGLLNWSDLASGVYRIRPAETLFETICRIRALTFEKRHRKARFARRVARALNWNTIQQWLDIFRILSNGNRRSLAAFNSP
jgi:glycosyltransferase involved in cell wall biosynthesis